MWKQKIYSSSGSKLFFTRHIRLLIPVYFPTHSGELLRRVEISMPQIIVYFCLAEGLYGMMKDRSAVTKVLLVLTFSLRPSSAVTHTLEYNWTWIGEPGSHFTSVGMLDGEEFMFYNNTAKMIIKTEWIKELESDLPPKQSESWDIERQQDWLRSKLQTLKSGIQGGDTLQRVYGCEIDDNSVPRGYDESIYNGKDFISLNLNTGTWTAVDERAKRFTENWNPERKTAGFWKDFLEDMCVARLKKYMPYSTMKKPAGRSEGGAEGGADGGADGGTDGGADGGADGGTDGGADGGAEGWKPAITVPVVLVAVLAVVGFVMYKMKFCAPLRSGYFGARQSPGQ